MALARNGVSPRVAYYASLMLAFARYVQEGGGIALRTTFAGNRTEVTLVFDSERLTRYMTRLPWTQSPTDEANVA